MGERDDTQEYLGIVTLSAAQWGQEVTLSYAHKKPTRMDIARMADLLRQVADSLVQALR